HFTARMPGENPVGGTHPAPSPSTGMTGDLAERLRRHLHQISRKIGARRTEAPDGLSAALEYLEAELTGYGYAPLRIPFQAGEQTVFNLEVEILGREVPEEIFVVGAHYDGFSKGPAANDNGSGVAAVLELARAAALSSAATPERTLRFVFFVNEEPPHFQQATMGSLVYARACKKQKEKIVGMWSLETLGYYSDEEGSQSYPNKALELAFPTTGNFIAFVGNLMSSRFVKDTVGEYRGLAADAAGVPCEGAALPGWIAGVGWSDHWSFAEAGYPALMITDTAVFRDPEYHTLEDWPERLDTERLAKVVGTLSRMLATK
ncbi:MAG: M28 family peptidase, partial [Planctomycetota bacterium]